MDNTYIEYKDLSDLKCQFTVLFGSQNVLVYVWRSNKGLKRNTNFDSLDYMGAYVPNPYRKNNTGNFGEIHLIESMIDNGYIAHEIQHLVYDWLVNQKITESTNERQAQLAEEITRNFWTEYNKVNE